MLDTGVQREFPILPAWRARYAPDVATNREHLWQLELPARQPVRLQSAEHVLHGLWMYEQERLPMTAQIVRMNRKGGPEGVIDAVEERAPDGFSSIDDVLSFEQRKAIVRGYASSAGYAQEQVNKVA